MSFNKFQLKQIEKASSLYMSAHRPPAKIRPQLDYEIEVKGQSVTLYEVRPYWQDNSKILKTGVAKTTYVKTTNKWKVFWQRQDSKWHTYPPVPTVKNINEFLAIVAEDANGCFFG